jgi:AcrR family transcriptional regulator
MTNSPQVAKRLDNVYSGNMSMNDNSVNIKSYHHGDLRAALVAEGLRLLGLQDREDISLRGIARNIGVSATAVYRHFPDKAALLKALCVEGDARLATRFKEARDLAGGGKPGFDAVGQTYVHFAVENPALFRLMMSAHGIDLRRGIEEQGGDSFRILLDGISELTPDHRGTDTRIAALQSWAIVHGLATLMLDGLVPHDDDIIEKVIKTPEFPIV